MIIPKFYRLRIKDRRHIADNVYTIEFESKQYPKWMAGQHFVFYLGHENTDDRGSIRIYTISAAPHEKNLAITTRYFGKQSSSFKQAMMDEKKNNEMWAFGPSPVKDRYKIRDLNRSYVLLMGGIGITPARSVLRDLDHREEALKGCMIYSNENKMFAFQEELNKITKKMPEFDVNYIVGRIEEKDIKKSIEKYPKAVFLVSGPPSFVEAMKKILISLNKDEKDIRYDTFGYTFLGKVLQDGYI